LGHPFNNVNQDNVTQLLLGETLSGGFSDIAGSDYGYFFIHILLLSGSQRPPAERVA
jgi:hypothetical protein